MDVLSDVLRVVRLTGSIFFTADLYEPWSVISPGSEVLLKELPDKAECISLFHIVTEGKCWFQVGAAEPFVLEKGSVIIFPQGNSHVMCSNMKVRPRPLFQLMSFEDMKGAVNVKYGGQGEMTQFICGYLLCDQRFNPLLGAIPEVLTLTPKETRGTVPIHKTLYMKPGSWLEMTIRHLTKEVKESEPGNSTMVTRLTELLYIEVLRKYMNDLPAKSHGWLAGVRDHQIGKALKYLHDQPGQKWKVEQLADKVGASRSAFAQRFTHLIGESPMHYLTGWRMQLAKNLLLKSDQSLMMIAEQVGYDSDIAFNRAFKRHVGMPPASWRKQGLVSA